MPDPAVVKVAVVEVPEEGFGENDTAPDGVLLHPMVHPEGREWFRLAVTVVEAPRQ